MNDETKKISDLFDALPEAIQMVIYDGPLDNELTNIASEYQISETDLEKIKGGVLLVILNINKSETLEQTLLQETSVDKQNVKKISDEIVQRIILPLAAERVPEGSQNKETILNEIENPVPTKPIFSNPAGKNIVLDAQHNLPEQEKKILISSSAVPSRGPILNNFKNSFGTTPPMPKAIPVSPTKPVAPTSTLAIPTTPVTPKPGPIPTISTPPTTFATPTIPPVAPIAPKPISQPPQPSTAPIPPAPNKYKVDPYREPLE